MLSDVFDSYNDVYITVADESAIIMYSFMTDIISLMIWKSINPVRHLTDLAHRLYHIMMCPRTFIPGQSHKVH